MTASLLNLEIAAARRLLARLSSAQLHRLLAEQSPEKRTGRVLIALVRIELLERDITPEEIALAIRHHAKEDAPMA